MAKDLSREVRKLSTQIEKAERSQERVDNKLAEQYGGWHGEPAPPPPVFQPQPELPERLQRIREDSSAMHQMASRLRHLAARLGPDRN